MRLLQQFCYEFPPLAIMLLILLGIIIQFTRTIKETLFESYDNELKLRPAFYLGITSPRVGVQRF